MMSSSFADDLVSLIKNGSIEFEHVRNWTETRHASGFLDNLAYLEITIALNEYEQSIK